MLRKRVKKFFDKKEEKQIIRAIQESDTQTSGELRVNVESDDIDNLNERALFVFEALGMRNTRERNGVLIYLNPKVKSFLIMGDEGIHEKVGQSFWESLSETMKKHFHQGQYCAGTLEVIQQLGRELQRYFPYDPTTDTNELDDEVSYQI